MIELTEVDIDEAEISAVTNVLLGKWLTMGSLSAEFERRFAEKMQVKHAFAVTNCTAALHLANILCEVGPGTEVICPALTFVASANATLYTGGRVVFADVVSRDDLTIDPAKIESLLSPRTKAITVMHYGGFPCNMTGIMEIARSHNLKVIEDCAHAPFATYTCESGERRYVGAIGNVGCFSFFGNKNMTTGEGGMLTTNDDGFADKVRVLRSHGMTTMTYDRHRGHARSYDVVSLGYNYRTDEIRSAIGLCQLDKIDRNNARRRQVYQWYREAFKDSRRISVPFSQRRLDEATPHIMSVYVDADTSTMASVLRANGIQTSRHYELIPNFAAFSDAGHGPLLGSEQMITLPLSPAMTRAQVAEVVSKVEAACLESCTHE